MYPTFDISVRFFGIDWPHLFRISQGLIQRVEQLSETLLGTKLESLPPASGIKLSRHSFLNYFVVNENV